MSSGLKMLGRKVKNLEALAKLPKGTGLILKTVNGVSSHKIGQNMRFKLEKANGIDTSNEIHMGFLVKVTPHFVEYVSQWDQNTHTRARNYTGVTRVQEDCIASIRVYEVRPQ